MKRLIVTADDVGLHPGLTAGAIRAHREGIVTACSVVANGEAFDDAVVRLRDAPSLEVGVHLSLVEEKPLTDLRVPRSYVGFLPRYPFLSKAAVERELRAQIERVLATGLRVTHLNGHQHLHVLYFPLVQKLANEYKIGYVRRANDVAPATSRLVRRLPAGRTLSIAALSYLARRHPGGNNQTIGIAHAGHLDVPTLLALIEQIPDGITELVTHPGIDDASLSRRYTWQYEWEQETAALCDPRVREAIARAGIELTSPRPRG